MLSGSVLTLDDGWETTPETFSDWKQISFHSRSEAKIEITSQSVAPSTRYASLHPEKEAIQHAALAYDVAVLAILSSGLSKRHLPEQSGQFRCRPARPGLERFPRR